MSAFKYGYRCGRRKSGPGERARKGLYEWRDRLSSIVDRGIKRGEIQRGVNAKEVATLIISSLEGALVIGRLERNREALVASQSHLERYLETEVRLSRQ